MWMVVKFKTIKATVIETRQFKEANIAGNVEFFNNRKSGALIKTVPVATKSVFENFAADFRGDRDALSEESKEKLGNRPLPFPTNEVLLVQGAELLKPIAKQAIVDNVNLVRN